MDGKKKKNQNRSIIRSLVAFVVGYIKQISDLLHLAALEAQLAFKTLIVIVFLIFLLGSVITASWLSVLTLIFFGLLALDFSLLSASFIVVCINVLVLCLICYVIYKIKANLFFPGTVEQLSHPQKNIMELKHEKVTTEN